MCGKFSRAFRTHSDPFISDDVCCYSQPRFDGAAKFFSSENIKFLLDNSSFSALPPSVIYCTVPKNLFRNQNSLDGCNLRSGPILTASILTFFLTWSLFFLPFPSEFYLKRVTIIEPDLGAHTTILRTCLG